MYKWRSKYEKWKGDVDGGLYTMPIDSTVSARAVQMPIVYSYSQTKNSPTAIICNVNTERKTVGFLFSATSFFEPHLWKLTTFCVYCSRLLKLLDPITLFKHNSSVVNIDFQAVWHLRGIGLQFYNIDHSKWVWRDTPAQFKWLLTNMKTGP